MELINLKGNTYCLDGVNRIGIYIVNNNEAIIIDAGIDDEDGKEIIRVCNENNWQIKMLLITHAHPDHVGGASFLQKELNIPIYVYKTERIICENPFLFEVLSYGGYPHKYLKSKYSTSQRFDTLELTNDILPEGIEFFPLPGHNSEMVGFKTADNVYFLADAVAGENIITKHQLQFMFDVKTYFATLDFISGLDGDIFVPTHGKVTSNIKELVNINRKVILGVIDKIKEICEKEMSFDFILKELADYCHIKLNFVQYVIVSTTLRCYMSYMLNEGYLKAEFSDNILLWKTL